MHICCIFKWKSRFSRDAIKRCKFDAFLSGKAGFLMTHQKDAENRFSHDAQKGANLLHFEEEKQVFS